MTATTKGPDTGNTGPHHNMCNKSKKKTSHHNFAWVSLRQQHAGPMFHIDVSSIQKKYWHTFAEKWRGLLVDIYMDFHKFGTGQSASQATTGRRDERSRKSKTNTWQDPQKKKRYTANCMSVSQTTTCNLKPLNQQVTEIRKKKVKRTVACRIHGFP